MSTRPRKTHLSEILSEIQIHGIAQSVIHKVAYGLASLLAIKSSPPSAACMRQWTGSSLVQVMACRLFGAKPLPEPMLSYCQLDSWEHISVKFESEFYHFHSRKCNWICRLPKWRPFCPGGDELKCSTSRSLGTYQKPGDYMIVEQITFNTGRYMITCIPMKH